MLWPNWSQNAQRMADPTAYLLDTSAVLAHFRDEPGAAEVQSLFALSEARILMSAVSIAELVRRLSDLGAGADEARVATEQYVALMTEVVTVDVAVAYDAFTVAMATPERLPLADALIVACARSRGAVLVHRDRHLSQVPSAVVAQRVLSAG